MPHARVVTPNCREAAALLGVAITTRDDQRAAARALATEGATTVVVTGGDGRPGDDARDVVVGADVDELVRPRLDTANTHGSGCSFAAAVAAGLASGRTVTEALLAAKSYVHDAIRLASAWQLGAGHGPLNHFLWEENP